jgi:hypothetical protein
VRRMSSALGRRLSALSAVSTDRVGGTSTSAQPSLARQSQSELDYRLALPFRRCLSEGGVFDFDAWSRNPSELPSPRLPHPSRGFLREGGVFDFRTEDAIPTLSLQNRERQGWGNLLPRTSRLSKGEGNLPKQPVTSTANPYPQRSRGSGDPRATAH